MPTTEQLNAMLLNPDAKKHSKLHYKSRKFVLEILQYIRDNKDEIIHIIRERHPTSDRTNNDNVILYAAALSAALDLAKGLEALVTSVRIHNVKNDTYDEFVSFIEANFEEILNVDPIEDLPPI